jgi:alkylation response protein AidB-like acyl-CoA dehydrogenase
MHMAFAPALARPALRDANLGFDPLAAATDLAASLAGSALRRERAGRHAARAGDCAGDWMRASNLLALPVAREHGGAGASWRTVCDVVRTVARADGALARLLALHHLQIATVQLYAGPRQCSRLLADGVAEDRLWGDAVHLTDRTLVATPVAGGYLLNGTRSHVAGAVEADWLAISAWDPLARAPLVAVLPTGQPGVGVLAPAPRIEPQHPDTGTVRFDNVLLPEENVLHSAVHPAGRLASRFDALRAHLAQLLLANVALGIAEGDIGGKVGNTAGSDGPLAQAQVLNDAAAAMLDAAMLDAVLAHDGGFARGKADGLATLVDEASALAQHAAGGLHSRRSGPVAYS